MAVHAIRLLRHIHRLVSRPASDPESDAALLARFARDRDEDAFAALLQRHGGLVLGVCRRVLRDAQHAEDACQATFLVLARKAATIRRPDTLAAWLHGTAHRLALRCRRAESRRQDRERRSLAAGSQCPPPDPLDQLTARELLLILDEEVQRLPEVYRLPVLLCCLHGRTQEQAAQQLGWTPGSVKGRLERGRARLHARLLRRGLLPAAALASIELSRAAAAQAVLPAVPSTPALLAQARSLAALGPASGRAAVLATGVLRAMFLRKLTGAAALVTVAVIGLGAGLLAYQTVAAEPAPSAGNSPSAHNVRAEPGKDKPAAAQPVGVAAPAPVFPTAWQPGAALKGHTGYIKALAFAPGGKALASAGTDQTVRVWEAAFGKEVFTVREADEDDLRSRPPAVAFTPDGQSLATGKGNRIRFWRLPGGQLIRELADLEGDVFQLAFAPDAKSLVTLSIDRRSTPEDQDFVLLQRRDVVTGRELFEAVRLHCGFDVFASTGDGKLLALTGLRDLPAQRMVVLRQTATGKEVRAIRAAVGGVGDHVTALAFAPDGKSLAVATSDRAIRLWDTNTGKQIRQFDHPGFAGPGCYFYALAFSADGRVLLAGSDGHNAAATRAAEWRNVHWFEVSSGRVLYQVHGHERNVLAAALSSDGTTAATGGEDKVVRLWRQEPPAPPAPQAGGADKGTVEPERDPKDALRGDLAKMQGRWKLSSLEPARFHTRHDLVWAIEGRTIRVLLKGEEALRCAFTLDEKATPKSIDIVIPQTNGSKRTSRGIYKIEGDTLTTCESRPEGERPREFRAAEGGPFPSLAVFRR